MKKILLVGYMGCGKSTIAKLLSKTIGLPAQDLDAIIENKKGKTIVALFEQGEVKFRKTEHEVLKEALNSTKSFILSLGGGTPCYANNHEFLKNDDVISIYLKASITELVKRLENDKAHRPLLAAIKTEDLPEYIAKHLFDRNYFYQQSKHTIVVDNKTPDEIVNEIIEII